VATGTQLDLRKCVNYNSLNLKIPISSTDAARNLGECLARIKYTGDRYILMKNNKPVAELGPVSGARGATLRDAWRAMRELRADDDFANDLERVNAADRLL
jgi:antitoxin (DNA-binding transcriptional repressor) of toxin-antitoxin stability system